MRLREARERLGLSQIAAGGLAGISAATLQRYEYGQMPDVIATLEKLAEVYNVSLEWLIYGKDAAKNTVHVNDEEREILHLYRLAPPEARVYARGGLRLYREIAKGEHQGPAATN